MNMNKMFGTKAKRQILTLFFNSPYKSKYTKNQLCKKIRKSPMPIYQAVKEFSNMEVLIEEDVSQNPKIKRYVYSINEENIDIQNLRNIRWEDNE